jgi:hypothetical protein
MYVYSSYMGIPGKFECVVSIVIGYAYNESSSERYSEKGDYIDMLNGIRASNYVHRCCQSLYVT